MYKKEPIIFGVFAVFAAVCLLASCGNTAKIDYRMNVASQDVNNYFNWSAGGVSVKDGFDPNAAGTTGASKAQSTKRFDLAVTYDIPANAPKYQGNTIPGGLRSLFLFPVAPDSVRVSDKLTASANGKEVTIRYVHRDSAYEIKTDANGKLDVTAGCKAARGLATTEDQHTFTLKPEFSKTGAASGNMDDLDWSKITLAPDVYSNAASRHYTGALDVAFTDNILTIKGSLKEVK